MARVSFTCLSDLRTAGVDYDPVSGSTAVANEATVEAAVVALETETTAVAAMEAAVAVLEADGASPTQGHVNDTRTTWDALLAGGVETKLEVLEADAASPTQAHVNDLRTAWDAYLAPVVTLRAAWDDLVLDVATPPNRTAVVLSIDATAVTTISDLRKAVAAIMKAVEGSSYLTP